jgi:hypothetical protein
MTVTATKIDSSHVSDKHFITWAWPASTTINYNNPVHSEQVCLTQVRSLYYFNTKNVLVKLDQYDV